MPDPTTTICLPGEEAWELWKQGPSGMSIAQSVRLDEGGSPASFKSADCFGFPVISSYAVPVWAESGDPEIIDGVVQMQLEKNNLFPNNAVGQLVDTRIIERMESQTLVTATVLDDKSDLPLTQTAPATFEISPALFYLPDNSIVLWKELGRLIFCLTRGEHPLYFHALSDSELSPAAVSEIESLLMPLYLQDMVPELESIVLWTDAVVPGAEQALADSLHLPVKRQPKPAPTLPRTPSAFEPVSVAMGKIRAARLRRIRNYAAVAVAAYAAVILGFVGWYWWQDRQVVALRKSVAALRGSVGFVEPTLRQWTSTEPLREKDLYPIESLRTTLEPLSIRQFLGVKATSVRLEGQTLEIKGEGQPQNMPIQFCNFLKTTLKNYDWTGPTWGPQRNGLFTFTFTGKRKDMVNET